MREAKTELKYRDRFVKRLENCGYTVTENAKAKGKSGVEHTFDILAYRDDGFMTYAIAVGMAVRSDEEVGLGAIFNFDEKAYDTGISDKIFIAIPKLSSLPSSFAQKQRIIVFV